jgi:hypothetical protein
MEKMKEKGNGVDGVSWPAREGKILQKPKGEGGGGCRKKRLRFLGLGIFFFFFFCQKCPPCLAENEGYL